LTDIPPTDADYVPLRIVGDQLTIGTVAWDIRHRRKAGGVLRAEVRPTAEGGDWIDLTVSVAGKDADGFHGKMSIGDVPWLVRRWGEGVNGTCAEAGPVSDEEFEDFASRMGRKVRAG